MVKTMTQARLIQSQRVYQQKKGYAKAVRRYLLRDHRVDYQLKKRELPIYWGEDG